MIGDRRSRKRRDRCFRGTEGVKIGVPGKSRNREWSHSNFFFHSSPVDCSTRRRWVHFRLRSRCRVGERSSIWARAWARIWSWTSIRSRSWDRSESQVRFMMQVQNWRGSWMERSFLVNVLGKSSIWRMKITGLIEIWLSLIWLRLKKRWWKLLKRRGQVILFDWRRQMRENRWRRSWRS